MLPQELECVVFHQNGKEFMSTHVNGSHIMWKVSETNRPKEQTTTPYGQTIFNQRVIYLSI